MLAILAQCVFERLRAAREQATKNTIPFADDPVAKTILANKDRRARGRPEGYSTSLRIPMIARRYFNLMPRSVPI